jgi:microcystin-dependent protein
MIHEPRNIKDRVAVGDDIFIIEELEEGRVRLIPDPTHVLEVGTPINKALLQPIEDALGAVTQKLSGIDEGANRIPAGLIAMWSGSVANIPSGWALCNGSNGTPDLRDRFIVGAGGSYNVGNTGGANSVALNTNQIPSHNHGAGNLKADTAGSHTHVYRTYLRMGDASGIASGFLVESANRQTSSEGAHTHTISGNTSNTGGGQAHENRPPYYALCFIMKL